MSAPRVLKKAPRANARAWKPEEDEFLFQARSRSTPYKQIAMQLNKTELACRLHYHQLTLGTHRYRNSLSSESNRCGRSCSPMSAHDGTHREHVNPSITVSYSPSTTPVKNLTSPTPSFASDWCSPPSSQTLSSSKIAPNKGIGLFWPQAPALMSTGQEAPDLARIIHEYAQQNKIFWSNIAHQFPNFSQSPAELEAAVRTALGQNTYSPSPSPKSNNQYLSSASSSSPGHHKKALSEPQEILNRSLHSPSPKKCSVSSLLNIESDIGAPQWDLRGAYEQSI